MPSIAQLEQDAAVLLELHGAPNYKRMRKKRKRKE